MQLGDVNSIELLSMWQHKNIYYHALTHDFFVSFNPKSVLLSLISDRWIYYNAGVFGIHTKQINANKTANATATKLTTAHFMSSLSAANRR